MGSFNELSSQKKKRNKSGDSLWWLKFVTHILLHKKHDKKEKNVQRPWHDFGNFPHQNIVFRGQVFQRDNPTSAVRKRPPKSSLRSYVQSSVRFRMQVLIVMCLWFMEVPNAATYSIAGCTLNRTGCPGIPAWRLSMYPFSNPQREFWGLRSSAPLNITPC